MTHTMEWNHSVLMNGADCCPRGDTTNITLVDHGGQVLVVGTEKACRANHGVYLRAGSMPPTDRLKLSLTGVSSDGSNTGQSAGHPTTNHHHRHIVPPFLGGSQRYSQVKSTICFCVIPLPMTICSCHDAPPKQRIPATPSNPLAATRVM